MIGELLCPGQRQRRECLERKYSDRAMGQEVRLWESPFRKGFITENPDKVECISLILSGFSCSSVHFFGRRSLKMIFGLCKGIPAQRGRAFLLQILPQNGLNPAAEDTLYIWIFRYLDIQRFLFAVLFWRGFVSAWERFHGRIDALLRKQWDFALQNLRAAVCKLHNTAFWNDGFCGGYSKIRPLE